MSRLNFRILVGLVFSLSVHFCGARQIDAPKCIVDQLRRHFAEPWLLWRPSCDHTELGSAGDRRRSIHTCIHARRRLCSSSQRRDHWHVSTVDRIAAHAQPDHSATNVKAFAELLRAAGYFTTNRSKTDYQFESTPSIWDRQGGEHDDWRERKRSEPTILFGCEHHCVSREPNPTQRMSTSACHRTYRSVTNNTILNRLATLCRPILPNTAAVRKNWAWYHDNITLMDKMAGEVLDRLDKMAWPIRRWLSFGAIMAWECRAGNAGSTIPAR